MSRQREAKGSKFSPRLLTAILVAVFFGIALYLRVYLPYDQVFGSDWIKFTSVDAYYHMYLVDNIIHNFPHLMDFNPYFIYPDGTGMSSTHLFDWFLASIIWVISLGSPTQNVIDTAGVYFPAILGALTVIPIYFIGKEIFGRWAGVLSAGLIALLPSELLNRSILGFTDHHVAETLLTTVAILFLILAIKAARQRQLTFNHLKRLNWATSARPIIYSLLAGIFLGIYLLTWQGALLFVFIISVYFLVQFIIDHLKHKSTDYLCLVGAILFFVALLMFLPASSGKPLDLASLVIALLIPLVLNGISRLMTHWTIKPAYYPLALAGLGLAGGGIFYAIAPSTLTSMLDKFSVFAPTGASLTTSEMQPLLFPEGIFSIAIAWGNFTTSFFLGLIALGILIYLVIKHGDAEKSLLVVWSLVILAATLGQRRFGYYLAVNAALLTGYLSWRLLSLAGFREATAEATEIPGEAEGRETKFKKEGNGGFRFTIQHTNMVLAILAVFLLVIFPNIIPATTLAQQARFAPSNAWCSSLDWLRENTPDPLGTPASYYQLHESPPPGESYDYPESAYGVMAWWDYGYWITRIAHRIPNANPSQNPVSNTNAARFFTSQDEASAQEITQELESSYVIIDYATATSKFWAMATWAGKEETEFFDIYYILHEDELVAGQLFHPEYYRSLSTRLYNFDGKAVTPPGSIVISYQEEISQEGISYKLITNLEQFTSYEEAEAYISSQESGNYRIVGTSPFISPVPLEAIEHYTLIYSSDEYTSQTSEGIIPEVKIFEYTD
mgnify:CR=1 FL=1